MDPDLETDTKVFLKKKFKHYYFQNKIPGPGQIKKREFGIGALGAKISNRHMSFSREKRLQNFLKREGPYFISYSAAFYEFPENQPMDTKNWLGAELIFDLDVERLNRENLQEVKEETIELADFLVHDFGFKGKDLQINFSGSKGYHIHIDHEDVRYLGKDERQEIVDYVTGTGLDLNHYLLPETMKGQSMQEKNPQDKTAVLKGPTQEDVGWGKRIYDIAYEILSADEQSLKEINGIGPKIAKRIVENRDRNLKALKEGNWEGLVGLTDNMRKKILKTYAVEMVRDADKMVTIDTTRLIRLPDTLHGGSGLIAKRVKDLDSFNPLVDAIAFSDEKTKIQVKEKVPELSLNGKKFGPYEKGEEKVPEYLAVHLMLKRKAEAL